MRYFVLDGTFKKDRPQGAAFQEAVDAHHAYNDVFVKNGRFWFAVPNRVAVELS